MKQTPNKIISGKTIFYFIVVDMIIFLILVFGDYYIGSPGSARLEPYSPKSFEFILNNVYFYIISSTSMTLLSFWVSYLSNK